MTEKNEDKYFTLNTINQLGLERNEKLDAIEEATTSGGGGGDATAANQTTIIANQTNGTQESKCMGNDSGSQQQILVSNTGVVQTLDSEVFGKTSQIANQTTLSNTNEATIIANQTNGTQIATVGNTIGDGSGTATHLKTASDGSVHVVVENSDNVLIKGVETGTTTQRDCKTNSNGDLRSALIGNTAKDGTGDNYYVLVDADGKLETSGGGGGGSAPSNTYSNTAVSVLAPTGTDTFKITTSANIELTNCRNITITLYSVELSTSLFDVNKVGLEYSYDGTNFFTDLSSAGTPNFQSTYDINGDQRLNPLGGTNPVLIDGNTLFPDVDRGKFVRVVFLHNDASGLGANLEIIPIIILNAA